MKDYLLFREATMILKKNKQLAPTDIDEIKKLKAQMNLGARRVWKTRSLGGNAKKR